MRTLESLSPHSVRLFASMIGAKLQEISTIIVQPLQQPVVIESKVISLLPSTSSAEAGAHTGGIMGPLKASRGGMQASSNVFPSDAKTASSRLLHSALQSTREVKNKTEFTVRDGLSVPRDSRESSTGILKAPHSNNRGAAKNNNKRGHQTEVVFDGASLSSKLPKHVKQQQQYHVDNSSAGIGSVGSEQVGTVEYFEKMNKVAMLSGFKNAQEMLASQKEMLMLMQKSQAPAQQQQVPPSTLQTEAAMTNEQQQQHPFSSHPLSTPWGGGGRWTDGRTGRGRSFGRVNQSAFYAGDGTESAGAMQRGWWSDGGRWANGRAGRGGRAFVPSTQQTQVEATAGGSEGALSTQEGDGVAAAVASLPNTTRDMTEAAAVNKSGNLHRQNHQGSSLLSFSPSPFLSSLSSSSCMMASTGKRCKYCT